MTNDDAKIVLEFLHMSENDFLMVAFVTPIVFMMWAATFYFSSRFIKMGMDFWKKGETK
jgi:hypothetical protein